MTYGTSRRHRKLRKTGKPENRKTGFGATHRGCLVIMVKEPNPGRVKTRLGRDIGNVPAAWWFRHHAQSLLRRLRDPRWHTILAVSPDRTGLDSRVWPAGVARIPQSDGNLGDRMARIFDTLAPGPALIIGADIPGVTRAHIAAAFAALGAQDAVFGPASDGGYWLVGLKRNRPAPISLFNGVRWSTRHALSDTLAGIPGLTFSLIATLDDVDTQDDLARLSR